MSEVESAATELKTQYAAQVAGDLERNIREQERIGAEVAALEEQLRALRHDQTLLAELRRALGGDGSAQAGADTEKDEKDEKGKEDTAKSAAPKPSVPRQASAATTAKKRKKPATTRAAATKTAPTKTAATKPAAKSAAARTATKSTAAKPATTKPAAESTASKSAGSAGSAVPTASAIPTDSADAGAAAPKPAAAGSAAAKSAAVKPTLVELIREHLGRQSEPRSSAEIATALAEAHPEREIKPKVVRTTVEGLVAKGQVQRTKQGSSVFYTTSGSTTAPTGAAADAATEQAPETV
ncbi:hypothetical protein [Streptomyces beigongshangae]|uniref:hypothetical protein n=1 Tax=Streptomyces beigongshangae TaxID=2841597 RepID=UPI001C848A52|nr:hypothetical protein [Streptomyces sp. REN17]